MGINMDSIWVTSFRMCKVKVLFVKKQLFVHQILILSVFLIVTIKLLVIQKPFCHDFCYFLAKIAPKLSSFSILTTDLHPWLIIFNPIGVFN